MPASSTVIAVAAGKGGVGKTCITANLAIALARQGFSTIAADLDFGNSNLYSFLGLENDFPGIAEFLSGPTAADLASFLVPTGVPNLQFLPGDGWTPFTTNLSDADKQRLLQDLKNLNAAYLLLDLGAGSGFNTLDFFRISDRGILVTRPEQPSIISMLVFLKNFLLRSIDLELGKDATLTERLNELRRQPVSAPAVTVRAFRDRLASTHPAAAAALDAICARFRPRLVYNMADGVEDTQFFGRIDATLQDVFSLACDHIGFVPYDPSISRSLKHTGVLPWANLAPLTAASIDRIASRIVHYWSQSITGSADLLAEYVAREIAGPHAPAE